MIRLFNLPKFVDILLLFKKIFANESICIISLYMYNLKYLVTYFIQIKVEIFSKISWIEILKLGWVSIKSKFEWTKPVPVPPGLNIPLVIRFRKFSLTIYKINTKDYKNWTEYTNIRIDHLITSF